MSKLAIVIGGGEIGTPIYEMLRDAYGKEAFCRDAEKPVWESLFPGRSFTFLHICFPQTIDWTKHVLGYVEKYKPKAVIIHSTLHPGTTEQLNELCPIFYYSPVRGNIKDGMRWSLEHYTKYVSRLGPDRKGAPAKHENWEKLDQKVLDHLNGAGLKVKMVDDTTSLEYAKVLDLCWYGLNIAFYQELERICEPLLDYPIIREFIESTPTESEGKVSRTVYYGGFIGGHCVIPAFEKLLALHDVPMIKAALESNIKRERELTMNPENLLGLDSV